MRRDHILLGLLIILLIYIYPSTAKVGGSYNTTTTLTGPNTGQEGEVLDFSTTTTSSISIFEGSTDFFRINDPINAGAQGSDSKTTISNPLITITPDVNLNSIFMLKLPVTVIGSGSSLFFAIYDDPTSSPILYADIDSRMIPQMQDDGGLIFLFNSIQTSGYIPVPDGLSLSAGSTYYIELDHNADLEFEFYVDSTSNNLHNGTIDNYNPVGGGVPVYMSTGVHLADLNYPSNSISYTVQTTDTSFSIYSIYGDTGGIFGPSYDMIYVEVDSSNLYTITTQDITNQLGSSVSLSANVRYDGVARSGIDVAFDLYTSGSYIRIGTATTSTSGVASITHAFDATGDYNYRASLISVERKYSISQISVTKITAEFQSLSAEGSYQNHVDGTQVTISGYLMLPNLTPIANQQILVSNSSHQVLTLVTQVNGYFVGSTVVDLGVGIHNDFFNVSLISDNYIATDSLVDLSITKGTIKIEADDIEVDYTDQPVIIQGNVTDLWDNYISTQIEVLVFDGVWQSEGTQQVSGSFSMEVSTRHAGEYTYKIIAQETTNFLAAEKLINVKINKSSAVVSPLQLHYTVPFPDDMKLQINITDESNNPLVGYEVDFYYYYDGFNYLGSAVTDTSGIATLIAPPPPIMSNAPEFEFLFMANATHDNYKDVYTNFYVSVVGSQISFDLSSSNLMYESTAQFTIYVKDKNANPVDDSIQIQLTIEGVTYSQGTVDGYVVFDHQLNSVGDITIAIAYDDNSYPYLDLIEDYTITIAKGEYSITTSSYYVDQGETLTFSSVLTNHLGDLVSKTVELWYYDVSWIKLGEAVADPSGAFNFDVEISMGIGSYSYQYRVAGSVTYNSYTTSDIFTVENIITKVSIKTVDSYIYGDEAIATMYLTNMYDIPIAYKSIDVNFGSYSTTLTTDQNGRATYLLPAYITPGTYDLMVDFLGSDYYLPSSNSHSITIDGKDTYINWVNQAIDTYYGEFLNFSAVVTDANGNGLDNMDVDITIGSVIYSKTTNSTGHITFSNRLDQGGTVDIQLDVIAKSSFNPSSISTSIANEKRQLGATISSNSNTNTTVYGDGVIIDLLSYSNIENQVGGVDVELYYYDGTEYILIDTWITDSFGILSISPELPVKDANTNYQLKISLYHNDYLSAEYIHLIDIEQMDLEFDITQQVNDFGSYSIFTFQVVDINNNPVEGLAIILEYAPLSLDWTETLYTNATGHTIFYFPSPDAGDLVLYFEIKDNSQNYVDKSGSFTISVNKGSVNVEYNIYYVDDQIYLSINPTIISEYTLTSDYHNDLLIAVGNEGINISEILYNELQDIELPFVYDSNYYQIYVDGTAYTYEQELQFSLSREQVQMDVSLDQYYPFELVITLDQPLNNYAIQLLVNDIYVESYLTADGSILVIPGYDFLPGTPYTVEIVLPQQGWVYSTSSELTFTPQKITPTISHDIEYLHYDQDMYVTVTLSSEYNVSGTTVTIEIYDGTWNVLGTGEVHNNVAYITIHPDYIIGEYQIRITVQGNNYISHTSQTYNIYVQQASQLELIRYGQVYYDTGGYLLIQLSADGTPLSGMDIVISSCKQCATNTQIVYYKTITTNSTGYATVFISPGDFTAGQQDFLAEFNLPGDIGSSRDSIEIEILPGRNNIFVSVDDYGITNYYDISISADHAGPLGNIEYRLYDDQSRLVDSGTYYNSLRLYDLVGNYNLSIQVFSDDSNYANNQTSISLGWEKLDAVELDYDQTIDYTSSDTIQFYLHHNNNSIDGQEVMVVIDGKQFNTTTNQGYFTIPMQHPGNYSMKITVVQSEFIIHDIEFHIEITIGQGELSFSVDIQDDLSIADSISFEISDSHMPLATYDLEVSNGTHIIYSDHLSDHEAYHTLNFSSRLLPGDYTLKILRYSLFDSDQILEQVFTIHPIEVEINYAVSDNRITILHDGPSFSDELDFGIVITIDYGDDTIRYHNTTSFSMDGTGKVQIEFTGHLVGQTAFDIDLTSEGELEIAISPTMVIGLVFVITAAYTVVSKYV